VTPDVTVIGSGASGVHFALTALELGRSVRMIDVGRAARAPVLPEASLNQLKAGLPDPVQYFLGRRFEAVLLPGVTEEYYGIPPAKDYVFETPDGFGHSSAGFAPLFSFAQGGLGEVWTGGYYPLTAEEIADFPFAHADLLAEYGQVARRIGITGEADDLARFMPVHEHLQPGLRLDAHSVRLLERYARVRDVLNRQGTFVGRTRVATLSQPLGHRLPCDYTGRCLWGCPRGSLYTPSQTLRECLAHPAFEYVPGVEVRHLRVGDGGRVRAVVGQPVGGGELQEYAADRVALAAGALLSTRIVLSTVFHATGERVRLGGLMDNRQVLVPFVNLGMLGQPFSAETYQYHLLGMGLDAPSPRDYVHGQITTLKTALVHPLIQRLPIGLSSATRLFRAMHAALGLVNVNFRDTRRDNCFVELDEATERLRLHYEPAADEPGRVSAGLVRVRRALRKLGCVVPPGMAHVRPMGASVHYAGTLPMTRAAGPWTTTADGESRDLPGLILADGATFPFLPAKNLTFTLMANASRIARAVCA
jgi:choline dehydrogenase-like flavoprotein